MIRTQKINGAQLVALLVLSRIYSIFSYSPSLNRSADGSVMLLALPISFVMICLLAFPVWYLMKDHPDRCLAQRCQMICPTFGKVVNILLCMMFLYVCCEAVSQFEYFMTTVMFPSKGTMIFFILLTLTACYFACMGIEPIARVNSILTVIIGIALALLALCLLRDIKLLNITSPLINGWKPVLSGACLSAFHNLELIAFAVLLPHFSGDMKKSFLWYNLWVLIIFEAIDFLVVTVLADYATTRALPIFTLANAASVPFMQSMDALYNSLWSFIALARASLYLFLAARSMTMAFGWRFRQICLPVCTAVVLAGGFVLSQSMPLFSLTYSLIAGGFLTAVFLLVVPAIALVTEAVQSLRKRRSAA